MRANTWKPVSLIVAILLLAMATTVWAQDSAPAAATSCTTVVNPGQSIQAAVSAARNGQTVCVRTGTYNEQVLIKPLQTGVTLMAYPGERPVIDGQNTLPIVTKRNKYPGLLHITGSNVTVDGFIVRNSNSRGVVVAQVGKKNRLQNVTVRNLQVENSRDAGVVVNGNKSLWVNNVLVENTVVYNNLLKNAGGAAGGSGLTFIEAENSTSRNNVVAHNYGEGLVAGRFTRGIVLEGNTAYDNRGANIYLINTQNPLVKGNYIFCTDDPIGWRGTGTSYRAGPGLQVRDEDFPGQNPKPPPSSGQVIINNIVVGCGANFGVASQVVGGGLNNAVVANNSFINARGTTGTAVNNIEIEGRASLKNTRFVNNIVLQSVPGTGVRVQTTNGTPDMSSFTVRNNLYSQAPGASWPTNEPGRVIDFPLLVNAVLPTQNAIPEPGSYALLPNSPAIDRGTAVAEVTDDFFLAPRTGAHDIGADESGGSNRLALTGWLALDACGNSAVDGGETTACTLLFVPGE